ncbi:MAG: 2-oxo-4-hydroxy-4-carboxy-5-ureidoimidazoline decarboxylase [Rhodospirillaceae bacterium]|nr:2-oxo-4-hydroxy-4-carboxy-5-ureidoimidazoline decarboxylase [Rhodospirillaceae bacterium]
MPSHMTQEDFMDVFGGVYEHTPWIAEAVYAAGLTGSQDTVAGLHDSLRTNVDDADDEKKLALLRAHPDLAGKLAISGELTADSTSEQASAQLDKCTPEEFAEFQSLNDRYKEAFGFPYILAVRGRNRQEILENFRSRVDNTPDTEFAEALKQVHRIALLRIEALFQEK